MIQKDFCDSREIAFCKRLKIREVSGVLVLQGSEREERGVGKEVGEAPIFVADFDLSKMTQNGPKNYLNL